jgi:hypothetical protein
MTIEELEQIAKSVNAESEKYDYEVNVCLDLACASQGADRLREELVRAVEASGKKVLVRRTGCDLNEHFDKQVRVVLENAGHIDPEKIDEYIARDGYKALLTALTEMTPNGVIHRITESGLRGRGGGGYPTGLKWSTVGRPAAT